MTRVKIPLLKTPEAFVTHYVANKIGFNVRVAKTTYDEKDKTYTVTLKAIIPSLVKLDDKQSKTFVYTFEDIAHAYVREDHYDFDFIQKPKAPDLDLSLIKKFDKLTHGLQNEILKFGELRWGNFTSVRYWLNPLRSIVVRCLNKGAFREEQASTRYRQYFHFLQSTGWINYEKGRTTTISATNKLKALHEQSIHSERIDNVSHVADLVLGSLYANHFDRIRDELRIFGPDLYATATKAYYADAVREGKSIPMSQYRLWLKYKTYNYNPRPSTHKEYTFPNAISELVSNRFLQYKDDDGFITANPELMQKVMPYHDDLAKVVIEI